MFWFYNFTGFPTLVCHLQGWPSYPGFMALCKIRKVASCRGRELWSQADLAGINCSPAAYSLCGHEQVPSSFQAPRFLLLHQGGRYLLGGAGASKLMPPIHQHHTWLLSLLSGCELFHLSISPFHHQQRIIITCRFCFGLFLSC